MNKKCTLIPKIWNKKMVDGTIKEVEVKPFMCGVIKGIQFAICKSSNNMKDRTHYRVDEGTLYITHTTDEQYAEFMRAAEEYFPGLCEFNCEDLRKISNK